MASLLGLQPKRAGRITSPLLPLALLLDIIYSLSLKPKTCSSLSVLSYPLLFLPISSLDNILMISFQWSHSECYGAVLWWDLGSQRQVPLFVAHGMEQCARKVGRRDWPWAGWFGNASPRGPDGVWSWGGIYWVVGTGKLSEGSLSSSSFLPAHLLPY